MQSHSNKLHHSLKVNFCISSNVFRTQSRSIGLRVVKSQEVYCVVVSTSLHNAGPLIEVVKTWSVSRRSYAPIARRTTTRIKLSRRTNSIYFFDTGAESSRQDGWTDKWMYVAPYSSLEHRGDASRTPALSLTLQILECVGRTRLDIFFLFLSFSFRLFRRSYHPFLSLLSPSCAIVPLERSLQVLEDLFTIWKYTFIFGESYRRTGRHVSTRTKPRALAFEIRHEKIFSIFWKLFFRLKIN